MLEIITERLVGNTDMTIVDGLLKSTNKPDDEINILSLKPTSGKESAFIFCEKNTDAIVCHIGITWQRSRFEVSYGTEEPYQNNGYMKEALSSFLKWLKNNTKEMEVWGLPNGPASEHILIKCGFKCFDPVADGQNKWYRFDTSSELRS